MKRFFVFLLLIAVPLCAMEEKPCVQCRQEGNLIEFSLVLQEMPEIKIKECNQCGKKALKLCAACRVTYYCSPECQKGNWPQHKSVCKKLQGSQQGDIAQMRNLFSTYMEEAAKTRNKKLVKKGLFWHCATIIRLRQDVGCSKDSSTQASIERVQFDHSKLNALLLEQKVCTEPELEEMHKETFKQALAWVQKITEEKKLVPPFGIRIYGMGVFIDTQMNAERDFIPQEQWHERRMQVIRQYQKAFAEVK